MEFSTPIIVVATWVVAAFAVSRYFASMGHSKGVSYGMGVVMGLVAAAFVYFVNAPRERQQRQLADLNPQAAEEQTHEEPPAPVPPPQEQAPPPRPASPQEPVAEVPTANNPAVSTEEVTPPPVAAAPSESEKEFAQEMDKVAKEMSFGEEDEDTPPPPQKKAEKSKAPEPTSIEPPKAPEQPAAVAKPEPSPPPTTPEPKPDAKPAPPRGPFELSLTATAKEVWVRVSVDGAPVQTRRLQEGQSFSWKAKRGFVVSADNAGGLRASLNGKALPRLGPEGRSRANMKIP